MAFHVSSSAASAADPNRAADGGSHSTVANATRKVSNLARGLMARYVNFNLSILSHSISAFSFSPQGSRGSSLDQHAFIKTIFDQVTHRISGKQNEFDAALRRMHDLLNAASAKENSGTAPYFRAQPGGQHTAPQTPQAVPQEAPHTAAMEQPEPARTEPDPQEQARRQAEQQHAAHLHRTHAEIGRSNALSLLDAHAAPGSHEQFGNRSVLAGDQDAAILAETRRLRNVLDGAGAGVPSPATADTSHE